MQTQIISGGAAGADALWTSYFSLRGCVVKTYRPEHMVDESDEFKVAYDDRVNAINLSFLHRNVKGTNEYVHNLLRRNIKISNESDIILAIGQIALSKQGRPVINGGTAWAAYDAIISYKPVLFYNCTDFSAVIKDGYLKRHISYEGSRWYGITLNDFVPLDMLQTTSFDTGEEAAFDCAYNILNSNLTGLFNSPIKEKRILNQYRNIGAIGSRTVTKETFDAAVRVLERDGYL